MHATLDGAEIPMYKTIQAKPEQILSFGEATEGMRTYLLIGGGLDMPKILGSSSTLH